MRFCLDLTDHLLLSKNVSIQGRLGKLCVKYCVFLYPMQYLHWFALMFVLVFYFPSIVMSGPMVIPLGDQKIRLQHMRHAIACAHLHTGLKLQIRAI